ncbi:DUF1232 domain-containing protein [Kamptonema cortianum]|nr:DUF1232 domain-containing protein [Geitlerinema splendidum]MDK3162474.1 DUF1232 domain-containing protein [Kamptonema cortianum]
MSEIRPSPSPVPWKGIVQLLVGIAYGISPIDLIPDVIVMLGWVDDAIAVPLLIGLSIFSFIRHRKLMKKQNNNAPSQIQRSQNSEQAIQKIR